MAEGLFSASPRIDQRAKTTLEQHEREATPVMSWIGKDGPMTETELNAQRKRLGRSAPRSRSGCITCKKRRVRCDETRPVCKNCTRLERQCYYLPESIPRKRRSKQQGNNSRLSENSQTPEAHDKLQDSDPGNNFVQDILPPFDADFSQQNFSRDEMTELSSFQAPEPNFNAMVIPFPNSPTNGNLGGASSEDFSRWLKSPGTSNNVPNFEPDTSLAPFLSALDQVPPGFDLLSSNIVLTPSLTQANSAIGTNAQLPTDTLLPNQSIASSLPNPCIASNTNTQMISNHLRPPNYIQNVDRASLSNYDNLVERKPFLLKYFVQHVQLPLLSSIGEDGWLQIRAVLDRLSKSQDVVSHALSALSEIYIFRYMNEGSVERKECKDRAFAYYGWAKEDVEKRAYSNLQVHNSEEAQIELIAIFLLACFELICREHMVDFQHSRLLDAVLHSGLRISTLSVQILSWIILIDAKAVHLGGKGIMDSDILEMLKRITSSVQSEFDGIIPKEIAEPDEADYESGNNNNNNRDGSKPLFSSRKNTPWTAGSSQPTSPSKEGKMKSEEDGIDSALVNGFAGMDIGRNLHHPSLRSLIFRSVQEPALNFHVTSQSCCRRIAQLDRHHRPRGASEHESSVCEIALDIIRELKEVWTNRPNIMDATYDDLCQYLQPSMAARLYESLRIYLVNYWVHFVYLHRIVWWKNPLSPEAVTAMEEIWRILQEESYGQGILSPTPSSNTASTEEVSTPESVVKKEDDDQESSPEKKTKYSSAFPNSEFMWPMFIYASETKDRDKQVWVVAQMRRLGKYCKWRQLKVMESEANKIRRPRGNENGPMKAARRSSWGDSAKEEFSLSGDDFDFEKTDFATVPVNANRAADLLEELIRRQNATVTRVDAKYLSLEMFGLEFSII